MLLTYAADFCHRRSVRTFSLTDSDSSCLLDHLLNRVTHETKVCIIGAKEFVHHRVRCIKKLFWTSKEARRVFFN